MPKAEKILNLFFNLDCVSSKEKAEKKTGIWVIYLGSNALKREKS